MAASTMQNEAEGFDFFAFNLYYAVGFYDIFKIPLSSSRLGGGIFVGIYALVVFLFGIPAFADEVAYLMSSGCRSRSPAAKKWFRSFEIIALMQTLQLSVSESNEKLELAITQIFTLVYYRTVDVLPLLSKKCRLGSFWTNQSNVNDSLAITVADSVDISRGSSNNLQESLLQPSCLRRPRSEIACIMHMLFSDPGKILLFSVLMLTIVMLAYAIIFGRSMQTYGKIGRIYLALVVLCIATLLLHFVGKHRAFISTTGYLSETKETLFSNALVFCIHSLGVANFQISVIGARACDDTKQNFVLLSICVCVVDFAISTAFTGLNYLRKSAVEHLCAEFTGGQFEFDDFMSMPDATSKLRNSSESLAFTESVEWGALQMSESLLMFRETSGSVPWTVYLPFHSLITLFSVLMICIHFVLSDLQALRLFKRSWQILGFAVLRLGLVIGVMLLRIFGQLPNLTNYIWLSGPVGFFLMKIFECVTIHLGEGFSKFIEGRRSILSATQRFQLFLFNWYLAPSIMFLYNFGYPVACAVLIMVYQQYLLTLGFWFYFLLMNALPAVLTIFFVHAYLS